MPNLKLRWTQPQLIVLTRGTPAENVLLTCKVISAGAVGATDNTQSGCQDIDSPSKCGACQDRSGHAS